MVTAAPPTAARPPGPEDSHARLLLHQLGRSVGPRRGLPLGSRGPGMLEESRKRSSRGGWDWQGRRSEVAQEEKGSLDRSVWVGRWGGPCSPLGALVRRGLRDPRRGLRGEYGSGPAYGQKDPKQPGVTVHTLGLDTRGDRGVLGMR